MKPDFETLMQEEARRLRRVVESEGLCGLANDTKWRELERTMQGRAGWTPRYRYRRIDSTEISQWDRDWWFLPPPISLLWLEIEHVETNFSRLPAGEVSHVEEFEKLLRGIGFDYRVYSHAIRIFGYAPRDEMGGKAGGSGRDVSRDGTWR